jgi:uncharacterized membrane protein
MFEFPVLLLGDAGGGWGSFVDTEHPVYVIAVLLGILAAVFRMNQTAAGARFFRIIPAILFCYFVPALFSNIGLLPMESAYYKWIKDYILPCSLVLLILALDLKALAGLGPKALILMVSGTAGVVIGGPLALAIMQRWLPDDAWQGMGALSGSWIGGGANFLFLQVQTGASATMIGTMVVVDVVVASVWMGVLLFFSGRHERIDAWLKADASSVRRLEESMTKFQEQVKRVAGTTDYLVMLAIAFAATWIALFAAKKLPVISLRPGEPFIDATAWKFIVVTAIGLILSLTPLRNYEGAGASKLGSAMIFLLVACIGAGAKFGAVLEYPQFVLAGMIWMSVHAAFMLIVCWLLRAPVFFMAVASQANIGGAASAPVVASAFHPALAPVGALLAVGGYVLGTYAGLLCVLLLRLVAGA